MPSIDFRSDTEMLDVTKRRAAQMRRRKKRIRLTALGALSVVVLGATAVWLRPRAADPVVTTIGRGAEATATTLTRPPLSGREGWRAMAQPPLSGRSDSVTAWTGTEMLVWGGMGETTDVGGPVKDGSVLAGDEARHDGAAYQPKTNSWRKLPDAPLPKERGSFASVAGVWTGRELVLWEGRAAKGAAYDPRTNRWRKLSDAPIAKRTDFSMTWTGEAVIIYGGRRLGSINVPGVLLDDGAAYDPSADRWEAVRPSGTPRKEQVTVLAGHDLVVMGGLHDGKTRTLVQQYDTLTDTWSTLDASPLSSIEGAVWTGKTIIAVGPSGHPEGKDRRRAFSAASYDRAHDKWTILAAPEVDRPVDLRLIWTGREAALLGSPFIGPNAPPNATEAFNPATGTWRNLPSSGLTARSGQAVAWTGTELITWGGAAFGGFGSTPLSDGAVYRPGKGN